MQQQQQQRSRPMAKSEEWRDRIVPGLRTKPDKDEFHIKTVWRAGLLEFIATTLFVFYACGSVVATQIYGIPSAAGNLVAGLVQGFAIATLVYAIAHTSGGQINPAVTLGLMITRHIGVLRGICYMLAQIVGGIVGAGLLRAVLPEGSQYDLGVTQLSNGTSRGAGFFFEFIITFTLLFTIFGTALSKESNSSGTHVLAPIPIGFAVFVGVAIAFSFTGGSINPARTFGPAVMSGTWHNHWIYWLGPMGGAATAALLQRFILIGKLTPEDEKRGDTKPNPNGSNNQNNGNDGDEMMPNNVINIDPQTGQGQAQH